MVDDQVSSCEQGTLCDCMELVLHNHSYCNLWLPYKQHKWEVFYKTLYCLQKAVVLTWCAMWPRHVTSRVMWPHMMCHVTTRVMWPHMMCHVTTRHVTSHDVSCDHTRCVMWPPRCVMWPHTMCHVTSHDVSCDHTMCHVTSHDVSCDHTWCVMWPHVSCDLTWCVMCLFLCCVFL